MALLFVSCGVSHIDENSPVLYDLEGHWNDCSDCGERENYQKHDLDDDNMCVVCGVAIYKNEDGSGSLCAYDEQGTMILMRDYDENGNMFFEQKSECEYYEDGNIKNMKTYFDGVLDMEEQFLYVENSEFAAVYLASSTTYNEDGTKETFEYNENLEALRMIVYDASGAVKTIYRYVYEHDDNGNIIHQTIYANDIIYCEYFFAYDEDGGGGTTKQIDYDENGNVAAEHDFTK